MTRIAKRVTRGRVRRMADAVVEWWIVVPFVGVACLLLCIVLAAAGARCDTLGEAGFLMTLAGLALLIPEPVRIDDDF